MKLKDIKLKTCPFCDGEGVLIHSKPDDAELVVSNYTIGFVATDVEYNELWNQIILSSE